MWGPLSEETQPRELLNKPDELLAAHREHMAEKIRLTGKRVSEWDVINHIVGWGRCYSDLPGGLDVYVDTIKYARDLAPWAELWVNEGQIVVADGARMDEYERIIRYLVAHDAKPDGIGFMAHFRDTPLPSPEEVYRRIDRFARIIPKVQFTEFDVDCGDDEQLQADYLRDIMTIGFSHPAMEGIVMWGFWEGRHWRPPAALWRKDWSIKPAGEAWLELVRKEWWTEVGGVTGTDGVFKTRGFMGNHEVTASYDVRTAKRQVMLPRGGAEVTIVVE